MSDSTRVLFAGPFQLLYDNGFIRRISYSDHEVLRMIYFALRDENWTTLKPILRNEKIEAGNDHFTIRYDCFHEKNGTEIFRWNVAINGTADGSITFEILGVVLEDLKKNRAGFCILHPIRDVVGQPAEVHHPDNTTTAKQFPVAVSPENPFKQIRKLQWQSKNLEFELSMEGDVFETEDQRNWTDASFKTFCTPQDLPFPVQLKKGDQVWQKVSFRSLSRLLPPSRDGRTIITLSPTEKIHKLPFIGIGASTEFRDLQPSVLNQLKQLKLDHYRIEVYPGKAHWVTDFSNDYQQASEMDLPLEVGLHLSGNYKDELDAFVTLCLQNRVRLKSVLLLSENKPVTTIEVIDHVVKNIKKLLPKVLWGAGTDYNFKELNKNRLPLSDFNFVSYSAHPQEHAFDDLSLIENLEGQKETALSAKQLYPNAQIFVSPVTLRKRFNPSATDPSKRILTDAEKADPRQITDFTARWMFGSLRALADAGTTSATYFQSAGKQGLVSETGQRYPVYEMLLKVLPFRDREIAGLHNTHPHLADALLFKNENGTILGLVNYTHDSQTILYDDREIILNASEITFVELNGAQ